MRPCRSRDGGTAYKRRHVRKPESLQGVGYVHSTEEAW